MDFLCSMYFMHAPYKQVSLWKCAYVEISLNFIAEVFCFPVSQHLCAVYPKTPIQLTIDVSIKALVYVICKLK